MDDKRRSPRFTVDGVDGQMVFATEVDVLNLSLGGVAIRADRRLNIGAEYGVQLQVSRRCVALRGQVVWSVLSGLRKVVGGESAAEYSAGLRFTDVLTEKMQGLLDFIEAHKVSEEHRLSGVRFQINAPGKAFLDSSEAVRVKVVSLSGLLVESTHPLRPEEVCNIEFAAPLTGPIRFRGRVASRYEILDDDAARYEMGIEYQQMAQDDRDRLESFVRRLSS